MSNGKQSCKMSYIYDKNTPAQRFCLSLISACLSHLNRLTFGPVPPSGVTMSHSAFAVTLEKSSHFTPKPPLHSLAYQRNCPTYLSSEIALAKGRVAFLMIRFLICFIFCLELPAACYSVDFCLLKSLFYFDSWDTILSWLTSVLSPPFFVSFLACFLRQTLYLLFLRLPSFLFPGLSSWSCPHQSPQLYFQPRLLCWASWHCMERACLE